MIGLLRPNTPFNTTRFLSKKVSDSIENEEKEKEKVSPRFESKTEFNEISRECFSQLDEGYNMADYQILVGSRTPEPKLSPIKLPSDYDMMGVSHYSDNNVYYDEDDVISGTMEGLVNENIFDTQNKQTEQD